MKRSTKKGFTIVELVIVIAIIAILAAVLIPTFASLIQKANESKDTQLVKNLNTALAADNKEHKTMTDALDAAVEFGYDVGKINASATGNEILWDSKNDVFCYLKDGKVEYIPETSLKNGAVAENETYKLWKIYTSEAKIKEDTDANKYFSIYWNSDDAFNATLTVGFDAGSNTAITELKYERTTGDAQEVVIRTKGATTLTVDAEKDTIYHYGEAGSVKVIKCDTASYHEFGEVVGNLEIFKGRLELAASANVGTVLISSAAANDVKIEVADGAKVGTVAPTTEAAKTDVEASTTIPAEAKKNDVVTVNNDYAGGLGTERSPYLIANAEQLLKVINAKSGYKNFKFVNDIDLTSTTAREYDGMKFYVGQEYQAAAPYLYGHVIDGNGYSVYMADDVSFCGSLRAKATLKNITFHMNGRSSIALEAENAKLINVITKSDKGVKLTNNEALFVRHMLTVSASLYIKDCKNYANITSDATTTNYNGIFAGCYSGSSSKKSSVKLTVENFENYGNIACGKIALVGNIYNNSSPLKISLTNVKNYGLIRSLFAPANQYVATKVFDTIKVTVDGATKSTSDTVLTNFVSGSDNDNTLAIAKNSDGTLSITAASNTNVSYYVVSIGIYTTIDMENVSGTNQIAVCEKIDKFDGTKNTTMKVLGFMNAADVSGAKDLSGMYSSRGANTIKIVTVNGTEYYVLNVEGEKVNGTVMPKNEMITVTAYGEDGMPIAAAIVGNN